MRLVFSLIGFPLILLASGGLLIYAIAKQSWKPLLTVAVLWGLTILLIIIATIADDFRTPIRLTKADIVGEYRVDTNFFSGINATWQYDHYKFMITPSDSIIFYVTNKDTVIKTFKHRLVYSSGPPDLWCIQSSNAYHVIKHPPTLYRGHKKFYYVFTSDIFGNIFFRKVKK